MAEESPDAGHGVGVGIGPAGVLKSERELKVSASLRDPRLRLTVGQLSSMSTKEMTRLVVTPLISLTIFFWSGIAFLPV